MAEKGGGHFPFNIDQTPTPYLAVSVLGHGYVLPSPHIRAFKYTAMGGSMSSYNGYIELYDSFDAGRGNSSLDYTLLRLFAAHKLDPDDGGVKIVFGWSGGATQSFSASLFGMDYYVDDQGLTARVKFFPVATTQYFHTSKFEEDLQGVSNGYDALQKLIEEYNSKVQKDMQYVPSASPVNAPISSIEFKGSISAGDLAAVQMTNFTCMGKTFYNALVDILTACVGGGADKMAVPEIVPNGKTWKLIIHGVSSTDDAPAKRSYTIRGGGKSDVVSVSYSDPVGPKMFMEISTVISRFIAACTIEKNDEKIEIVSIPEADRYFGEARSLLKSMYGTATWENAIATPGGAAKLLLANDSDYPSATEAGKALLRGVTSYIAMSAVPSVEIKVLGDPSYSVGGTGTGRVVWGDKIQLYVNNPNGKPNPTLCGKYSVTGFEHEISNGQFFTTVKGFRIKAGG